MARALTTGSPETALIIDIGSRSTSIFVAQNGFLKFVSQTDFAGSSLTQNLAAGTDLSPREADIVRMYYGLNGKHPHTLEEIGEQFDLTRERVRQIKDKAIRRLKHTSKSKLLKKYLGD